MGARSRRARLIIARTQSQQGEVVASISQTHSPWKGSLCRCASWPLIFFRSSSRSTSAQDLATVGGGVGVRLRVRVHWG